MHSVYSENGKELDKEEFRDCAEVLAQDIKVSEL